MEITDKTAGELDEAYEKGNMKKLEAILFISGRFLSLKEIVGFTGVNPIILRQLIEKLVEKYSKDDSAIEIVEKSEMWKMDVKPDFVNMVNLIATGAAEFSKAEQETLAIIAYKQPVKQSVIIKIRGNKAYEHVKKFIDIGLLKAKKTGHTQELNLSDEFHDYFNVGNLQETSDLHLEKNQAEENQAGENKEINEEKQAK